MSGRNLRPPPERREYTSRARKFSVASPVRARTGSCESLPCVIDPQAAIHGRSESLKSHCFSAAMPDDPAATIGAGAEPTGQAVGEDRVAGGEDFPVGIDQDGQGPTLPRRHPVFLQQVLQAA